MGTDAVAPVSRVRPGSRWRMWVTAVLVAVLVVTLFDQPPARAAQEWSAPEPQDVTGVPVIDAAATSDETPSSGAERAVSGPREVQWPAAGSALAELPVRRGFTESVDPVDRAAPVRVRAGSLPVALARGADTPGGTRLAVTVHERDVARKVGRDVLVSVAAADGRADGSVAVELSYAGFAHAYGGDYGSRLRLVALPACALSAPQRAECRQGTPLPTRNDPAKGTVTAQVSLAGSGPMLLSAQAGPSGDNGDYTATDLSAAGTWQVSQQTGDFSWSYPLRMPPSLGGPAPTVTLAHSSGSIDGRTATTNNQGSWIGDGWDSWPGYIERKYASCADDNPGHKTGDQCWFNDNATLSLNGRAGELIQSGGVWRLKNDDGTRIERLTDAGRANGDNDNEYWKVTTTDGWQYFFGYHRLPGWSSGKPVTNSTWTVPVYGNNAGEPCYNATFANARCDQAWRWNLDYVVDPHDNTMAYFYGRETGAYGRDNTPSQRTTYTRGGYLERIEYGMRQGAEYAQAAPLRVVFTTAERCLSGCWTGAAWTSDPNPSAWPDTPWDQYCDAAPCDEQLSPTFWTARRLTTVTTQVRNGTSSYRDVESWTLRQEFLNAGTGESTPMWLRGITRTGHVTTAGGAVVSDPEITFDTGNEPLPNRVDGPNDGRTNLNRWRIRTITTESGGQIHVTYSEPDCTRSSLPTPHTNTKRCMPAYYSPSGEPTLDWFHKYVVTRIDLDDTVTDQPTQTIFYDYLDDPAWHYNTDEITKDKYRTWGEWRGYGRVRVRHGDPTNGQQTAVEYRYLRGMHGDKLPSGTRSVSVTDSWGGSIEDHEALAGFLLQEITFNGPGGAEVSSTRNEPWKSGPTATRTRNGVTTNAWMVNTGTTRTRTALAAGGFRYVKTTTAFNSDGLPTTTDNFGDENVSGDETCTRLTYARNDSIWMIDKVSQTETLSGTCAAAANPAVPSTVLKRERTFYDNATTFGAAPTKGDVVRTEELDSWNGATPVYVRTSSATYDANGRVLTGTDARNYTTTTTYTTSHGGLVTQSTVTNPLGHAVTSVKEPAWDLPTKTTGPNGEVTELAYDGLGRLIGVWQPGRSKATQTPNLRFTYLVRNSGGPTAVTSETLLPTGNSYKKSINLYDGFLRKRQTQTQAVNGGRLLQDTLYNTRGEIDWTSAPYYDSTNTNPGTSLGLSQGQIPSITVHQYDGAGRETATIFLANGQERWRATTGYGGDRTHTTPPSGGTATTTITDAFGQTIELRQYQNPAQVGNDNPSTYDATTYQYDLLGQLTRVNDPAGNRWTYTYDLRGRQTQIVDPDKGTTTNTYDAAGNLVTTTSPLGTGTATLAYTYDALGRKTSIRDGSVTGAKRVEWIYDTAPNGVGKPARSIRWVGSTPYETRVDAYDSAGRPTTTSLRLPTSETSLCAAGGSTPCVYTTSLTYRPNGATATTTLPAAADLPAETLTFGYNNIGEQTGIITSAQTYVGTVTYNKLGQLTQRQFGNTGARIAVTSTFDEPTLRLTGTNVVPELKPEAANWTYTYNDAGSITKIVEQPQGQTADTQCFGYDYLTRLTRAWTPSSGNCTTTPTVAGLGGPAPYWHDWTYDATGNRLTETRHAAGGDTTFTYTHPASGPSSVRPHAVTQVQMSAPGSSWTRGFTYDNAGNMTTRASAAGNQQTLTFDPEGRLTNLAEGGQNTSFIYDADGNRLIRRSPTGTTLYLPDGTEISVTTGSSTAKATRYYTHLDTTIAVRSAAGLFWIIGDHHGTAELTINATNLAVAKRRSLPFGEDRGSPPSGWPAAMDKGFVGGTEDPTGLTHLGARYYDPAIGRFISVDPVIDPNDPQQLHAYAYGHNNPVNRSDPTGLWPGWLDKAASSVASAASKAGNWVANTASNVVQSIKEDPLKFAVGVAVGIAATAAVAAVCSTGVGCVILAGAVAGAAAAGAEYGVDVAQGDREFSVSDLAKEMAIGGAIGGATAGLGVGAGKLFNSARNALRGGRGAVDDAVPAPTSGRPGGGRPGCNSFASGTPVLLADGTTKPIEELDTGDVVLATDPETGQTEPKAVTATILGQGTKHLVEITLDTDGDAGDRTDTLIATGGHPFWVPSLGEWLDATDLQAGQWLQTSAGTWIQITAIRQWTQTATVHNLTVSDIHTYYVLAGNTSVLVHNTGGDLCPVPLSTTAKDELRAEARDIWQQTTGRRAIWDGLEVHHRIPLEWSHLMPGNPNRLSNLVGMRPGDHNLVTQAWNAWKRDLNGATPSAADIMRQALKIDRLFGHLMVFPK